MKDTRGAALPTSHVATPDDEDASRGALARSAAGAPLAILAEAIGAPIGAWITHALSTGPQGEPSVLLIAVGAIVGAVVVWSLLFFAHYVFVAPILRERTLLRQRNALEAELKAFYESRPGIDVVEWRWYHGAFFVTVRNSGRAEGVFSTILGTLESPAAGRGTHRVPWNYSGKETAHLVPQDLDTFDVVHFKSDQIGEARRYSVGRPYTYEDEVHWMFTHHSTDKAGGGGFRYLFRLTISSNPSAVHGPWVCDLELTPGGLLVKPRRGESFLVPAQEE